MYYDFLGQGDFGLRRAESRKFCRTPCGCIGVHTLPGFIVVVVVVVGIVVVVVGGSVVVVVVVGTVVVVTAIVVVGGSWGW